MPATSTAAAVAGISPLIYLVVVVHALLAVGLIVFVLLHSGKGTGLSSMFGGMSSAASGTSIIEKNLDRITVGLAVGWALTSVLLMMLYRPV
jgi:preprotein translocase subunit SecG